MSTMGSRFIIQILFLTLFNSISCISEETEKLSSYARRCAPKSEENKPIIYNYTVNGFKHEPPRCSGEIFLLNFIHSAPKHFDRRQMIRQTWASIAYLHDAKLQTLFVLGLVNSNDLQSKINEEVDKYGDIIQANFIDSYKNLTLKHLYALKWISLNCPKVRFVSKLDDDTLVNVPNLIWYLKSINSNNFIYGKVERNAKPLRDKGYAWTVSLDDWSRPTYPVYAKGFAYILSGDIIQPLSLCSAFVKFFWIDDVYIGEVASKLGISFIDLHSNHDYNWIRGHHASFECLNHAFLVGKDEFNPYLWRNIWRYIVTNTLLF